MRRIRFFILCFALVVGMLHSYVASAGAQNSLTLDLHGNTEVLQGSQFEASLALNSDRPVLKVMLFTSVGSFQETIAGNRYDYVISVEKLFPVGKWKIWGEALLDNGSMLKTAEALISVEPALQFENIKLTAGTAHLNYMGDTSQLEIYGVTSDGAEVSLIDSARVTVESSDTKVAALDMSLKQVVARGPGTAEIKATYADNRSGKTLTAKAPIVVNANKKGDLNGDGVVDISDFNAIKAELETDNDSFPSSGTNDARDLNNNGVIDKLDLKEISGVCDLPNCNYRPIAIGEATPTPFITPEPTFTPTLTPEPVLTPSESPQPTQTPMPEGTVLAPIPILPDLVVTDITAPKKLKAGGSTKLKVTIKNLTQALSGASKCVLLLAKAKDLSIKGSKRLGANCNIPAVDAVQSVTVDLTVKLSKKTAAGKYNFGLQLNIDGQVAEQSNQNNLFFSRRSTKVAKAKK